MSLASDLAFATRHPQNLNFLRPLGFQVDILSLPTVSYFCQQATLPGVTLGVATQNTPLSDIPWPGEKMTFSSFDIVFMVQSDLANYIELYNWMLALGDPQNNDSYTAWINDHAYRFPGVKNANTTIGTQFSDIVLTVLSANNNPVAAVKLFDAFPVNMSGLPFDVSSGDDKFLTCSASFRYAFHTITPIPVSPTSP